MDRLEEVQEELKQLLMYSYNISEETALKLIQILEDAALPYIRSSVTKTDN